MIGDYPPGTPLEIRGERWILAREERFASCRLLTLDGADAANATRTLRVLDPFDRPRRVARQQHQRHQRRGVLRAALGAIATARTTTGLWSAAAASIDVWPYQLEPALALLGGATRLLLADAVGLGKTIQAGLILAELRARGWIDRALIVCPAGLRDTWAAELRDRFGIAAAIVDQAALADRIATLPPGINPWTSDPIAIVSVDLLKRPEVLSAVAGVPLDLLIADEAHHLTPGTDRGAAVSRLAERTPWVALLSATPHSGDAAAFSYLTGIGARSDTLTVFRRTRRDVGIESRRRSHVLPVRAADHEQALFAEVDRYVRAIWNGRGVTDRAVRLVAITIARRAASSIAALTRTLSRRLALLSGDAMREPEQGLLPWDESDSADEIEGDAVLAARGLDDAAVERASVERMLTLAQRCGTGSKILRLLRMLRAIREPVLVFTEYRDTLCAIAAHLQGVDWCAIHGAMPPNLRQDATKRFNDGRATVLLATDAAGEGLNLHHRCRLVIDVELPWNPLRLEQRVGRVDRIGQRGTVHAIRLFHPGTIEARVLEHLGIRSRRADDALDRCATDADMAEAVFEGRCATPSRVLLRSHVLSAAAAEAERIIWQRSARFLGATLTSRLARTPANRRDWRRALERLARPPHSITGRTEPSRVQLANRIASIRAMLADRARVEYQRSLFDGRAQTDAAIRAAAVTRLDAALERTLHAAVPERRL
jgi:superfamily II DNA or RNA helicase